MKKCVSLMLMILAIMPVIVQAQWVKTEHKADALKGSEAYTSYMYTDSKGDFIVLWSDLDDKFRIASSGHIFDYEGAGSRSFDAIIGLYDDSDNLIKKIECLAFADEENARWAYVYRKNAKQIIKHIRENKGYVRIIAPLFRTLSDFDLTVPCFQSSNQTNDEQLETEADSLSIIISNGLDQFQQFKIFGIRDTVSMNSYLSYLKQWGKYNSLKYGITVDDTVSLDNNVLMHVKTRIHPNLVSSKALNIPIFLMYDIDVTIDTLPFDGFIRINDIRIRWDFEPDYYTSQILNLSSQQLEAFTEEVKAFTNSLESSGIKTKESVAFLLNESWLKIVQDAEDAQSPQAQVYLELFASVLYNTSWLITDFPHLAK